jgi:hypothetical protein
MLLLRPQSKKQEQMSVKYAVCPAIDVNQPLCNTGMELTGVISVADERPTFTHVVNQLEPKSGMCRFRKRHSLLD